MTYTDWPDEMTAEEYLSRMERNKQAAVSSGHHRRHTDWQGALLLQLQLAGIPQPELEYVFHPKRRWRFDLCWPAQRVAVEVDGGTYGRPVQCHNCGQTVTRRLKDGRTITIREGGRHNSGQGFEADREKWAEAALMGWLVIGVTPGMIGDGRALDFIQRAMAR